MKKIIIYISLLLISGTLFAKGEKEVKMISNEINIDGYYTSQLYVNETMTLPLNFEIIGETILFSSPDQLVYDYEINYEIDDKNNIRIYSDAIKFELIGELSNEDIIGTFKQSGREIPIVLFKSEKVEPEEIIRSQTPTEFDYERIEVEIRNDDESKTYYGTLTIPNNEIKNQVIIFATGSGIQDRDEEIFSHKPFLVISDFLTKNGYYTLRCDDYGYHDEDISDQTTYTIAEDISAQIKFLKQNYNFEKYIIFGHSEGGIIAQMLANEVDSLILMASPAASGAEIYKFQVMHSLKTFGSNEATLEYFDKKIDEVLIALLDDSLTIDEKKAILYPYFTMFGNDEAGAEKAFEALNSLWYRTFLKINPRDYLKKIQIPILILQGGNDTQVDQDLNISIMQEYLQNDYTIKTYETFNHLLQASVTGELIEYEKIETTIEEIVLNDILEYLEK